jgi:hypothetical protein
MSAVWLLLYLGSLVHLAALNGFGLKHPASWVVMVPVAGVLLLPSLQRRRPALFPPGLLRAAGLLGFGCALVFAKSVYLEAWDSQAWGPNLAIAGAGLGSLLPSLGAATTPGAGTWLWIAFWMATGLLDPALPILGAGLGGMLEGSGLGIGEIPPAEPKPGQHPWLAVLLFGLALPKPWWDFGIAREWAWASASVGLGAALAWVGPIRARASGLPASIIAWGFGLLSILYTPPLGIVWGFLLGVNAGALFIRPLRLDRAAAVFLTGLLLSFALHANAWIPGLRHLIWLGN